MASPQSAGGAIWKSNCRDVVMSLMLTATAEVIAVLKARKRSTAESYEGKRQRYMHLDAPDTKIIPGGCEGRPAGNTTDVCAR